MGRLDGKVALISGGARGQGATEAQLFCREGAKVVFGDVLADDGHKVAAEIQAAGGEATYVHLNVTSEADWQAAVDTAVRRYGKLDILVNNAGILIRKGIEETTEDDWDRIMAVNVKGVFIGTKYAIPALRQAGGGSIINISSTAGLVGSPMVPLRTRPRKRGDFTKATAVQHAKDKIRCNSVHPGPIDTEMMRDVLGDAALRDERLRRIPSAEPARLQMSPMACCISPPMSRRLSLAVNSSSMAVQRPNSAGGRERGRDTNTKSP